MESRSVFRIHSNIYDGAFCEKSQRHKAINYFLKNLHLRYLIGSNSFYELQMKLEILS